MKAFISNFLQEQGLPTQGFELQPIRADGSKREFERIVFPKLNLSFVTMANPPSDEASQRENFAYLMIGRHLHERGVPVPELYGTHLGNGWFIMEDMGRRSLQEEVRASSNPVASYEKVIEELIKLQVEAVSGFDTRWCCQTERYDLFVMRRLESDYFRDAFLGGYLGKKAKWPQLEEPFQHLADKAAAGGSSFLLHRDFQSRNITVRESGVGVLDWQGARLGPLAYDLASLLVDPYTGLDRNVRRSLYEAYLHLLRGWEASWVEVVEKSYPYLAIQRNLQILGAFGFLTRVRGKTHFEASIPTAVGSLLDLLEETGDRKLSPLEEVVREIEEPCSPALAGQGIFEM